VNIDKKGFDPLFFCHRTVTNLIGFDPTLMCLKILFHLIGPTTQLLIIVSAAAFYFALNETTTVFDYLFKSVRLLRVRMLDEFAQVRKNIGTLVQFYALPNEV
jgi:hypothetical protein